jgi:uncharacterized protein DUF6580
MSTLTFRPRTMVFVLLVVVIATLRVASFYGIGPLTIFTPLGAMALFSSAYFKGWLTPFLFPLLTLFVSDVIVSFTVFSEFREGLLYAGWFWTYAAFALIVIGGKLIFNTVNLKNIVIAVICATSLHWLISNFGMCIRENQFSASMYGEKLISSLPYELRFLAGTALFSAILFGGFELLLKRYPALRFNVQKSVL